MFTGGLRESQQTEIPVHGVTFTAMTKLLDFIYTSEIELDIDHVQEVLAAATLVQVGRSPSFLHLLQSGCSRVTDTDQTPACPSQIEDVISFCCDFLFSWMDDTNILEVHWLADMFGLQQLEAKVHFYILRNIQTLSRTEVYRQLPPDRVFRVLCSDELEVNSENEVYEAALHYHYSPDQVETDQVCLQVIIPIQAHFARKADICAVC